MDLIQINKKYGTQAKCLKYMETLRWGKVVKCPYCESKNTLRLKREQGRHHCNSCKRSFTVFIGTIFEDTRLPLPKWFMTIGIMLNSKSGIAAKEIHRQLQLPVKSAWFTAMKVRCGMIDKKTKLHGALEMDESYFGGKKSKKTTPINSPVLSTVTQKRGRGTSKIAVAGIVERGGSVKTKVVEKLTTRNLLAMLKDYAKTDESVLVTDGFRSYAKFDEEIEHITAKHQKVRKKGDPNVNTIEGFWSQVKNGIKGNFKAISKKYLPFYMVEYEYKYNNRKAKSELFEKFMKAALSDESCLLNYKPKKDVKEIVYK